MPRHSSRWPCQAVLAALAACGLLAGCGSGLFAISALDDDDDDGGGAVLPTDPTGAISAVAVGADADDRRTTPVDVIFVLRDPASAPLDVEILYTPPSGPPAAPVLLVGDTNLSGLASSPVGVQHVRQWDFASQLPAGAGLTQDLVVTVRTVGGAVSVDGAPADLGNDPPVASAPVVPAGPVPGDVPVSFTLADSSADPVDVSVEWREVGGAFAPATLVGGPLTGVATSPAGVSVGFTWDSLTDVGALDRDVELRLVPDDGLAAGTELLTPTIQVDNGAGPTVTLDGAAFALSGDGRRGLPLRFEAEGGAATRVVFQWRAAGGTFPVLPATEAELDDALADPVQRAQLQIATELPVAATGGLAPIDATHARLSELSGAGSALLAGGLAGRTLEVLRAAGAPVSVTAGWAANPLAAPVTALAVGDGSRALVLDEPAPGSARLREVELATGAVVADLGTFADGDPSTLALDSGGAAVLLASSDAGTWKLRRVELSSGLTTIVFTATGATELGTVRGLASRGAATALVTVGGSLVTVDYGAVPPTESTVLAGLEAPWGLALVPGASDRLLLAERDWTNPDTTLVEGRVVALDLSTLSIQGLPGLRRPTALALERSAGRLLALCDADALDGTRELCARALGEGGPTTTLAAGLPDASVALSAGPEGLRLVTVGAAGDLLATGGIQQARAITSYDPATRAATVGAPFDPALPAVGTWRILASSDHLVSLSGPLDDSFVWDSGDAPAGGDVVLRATPYEGVPGVPDDSGAPRSISAALDVAPAAYGGPGSTDGPEAVVAADLNGDGVLDLACANAAGDDLAIFFQISAGTYPALPDRTLVGGAVALQGPADLVAADADDDGLLDVVSANATSANLTIHRQLSPGVFALVPTSFADTLAPVAVVAADLDADGRVDLATANAASGDLTVFFQLPGGLYAAVPDVTLGGPGTTDGASALAVGDLDGDGILDLVSANAGTDTLTVFRQSAPGTFVVAPVVLGGPGATDDPAAVVIADLDGDGRDDVVAANEGGSDLAVFLRAADGSLPAAPSFSVSSPDLSAPRHLSASDVDGDGRTDLAVASGAADLLVFFGQGSGGFAGAPLRLGGVGTTDAPAHVRALDVDGDARADLVSANAGGSDLTVFLQRGGAAFAALPDVTAGGGGTTPGLAAVAAGDLDADGDLDLVVAAEDGDALLVFEQVSPAVFASAPLDTLGGGVIDAPRAVAAADLNGDGRLDVASANAGTGDLAIFYQSDVGPGPFPEVPDLVLGGGALGGPEWIEAADLDRDGRTDLVSANATGNDLTVFFQTGPGTFTPTTLGGLGVTNGVVFVTAADLDGNGYLDLACASQTLDRLSLFYQDPGGYSGAVDHVAGPGVTDGPKAIAIADLDDDGDLDLVSANSSGNDLTVFLQDGGVFADLPDVTLQGGGLVAPEAVAAGDVDGDGDVDLVSGNSGSDDLTLFRQISTGVFAEAEVIGGGAATSAARGLEVVDVDADGDPDLLLAQPDAEAALIFFASH